jgi:hypothetical protein
VTNFKCFGEAELFSMGSQADLTGHQDSQGAADMSSYSDRDTYSQAGDWLVGAVRRNPESLLLMAAGCCLMMRGGRSSSRAGAGVAQHMRDEWDYQTGRATPPTRSHRSRTARHRLLRATSSATAVRREIAARKRDPNPWSSCSYSPQRGNTNSTLRVRRSTIPICSSTTR